MSLKSSTEKLLKQHHIERIEEYGQHFLIDESIIKSLITAIPLSKEDRVLEIGPGTGNITKLLAEQCDNLIVVELDRRFEPILITIPGIECIFENALAIIKNFDPEVIVSNLPYQLAEPLTRLLINSPSFDRAALIVPDSFAQLAKSHPIFSAFFNFNIIAKVPPDAFYPVPDTDSVILTINHRPGYSKDHDGSALLRRLLYLQSDKILKNALRESLIVFNQEKNNTLLTKKQASHMIEALNLDESLLKTLVARIPAEDYPGIVEQILTLRL